MDFVGPPWSVRAARFKSAVVVELMPMGGPVVWVARVWSPVTVLRLLTKSTPPLLLAKIVFNKLTWAPAAVPMVAVCPATADAKTPFMPSRYKARRPTKQCCLPE